jgi:hypothetical protein
MKNPGTRYTLQRQATSDPLPPDTS